MSRIALAALIAVIVAPAHGEEVEDSCGANGFLGLVGQTGEIASMLVLDQPRRVIAPGSIVTSDYRLERINFDLDEQGMITRIWCG